MKCSSIRTDLTNWAIDHPGAVLPERLKNHIASCEKCRAEWESVNGWTKLLRPEEASWQPEEGFFERLTEQAMMEKRRAALTESTRRDLALDVSGWFGVFQRPLYRWLPVLAILLLIAVPSGLWLQDAYNTIGEFDYSSGQVLAQASRPLDPRKGMRIERNTSVQTPQDAETIVSLESGAEVCVAPLSRVTFIDNRTVRIDRGRAYFDIPKQKSGFTVQLPQGEVQVLGTAFHISVSQGKTNVTVTRGIVRLTNINASVQVESGMESTVALNQRPSVPQITQRIPSMTRWVSQVREQRNEEELRTYYPSLAAPKPKDSQP